MGTIILGILIGGAVYFFLRSKPSPQTKSPKNVVHIQINDEAAYARHKAQGLSLWKERRKEAAVLELENALKAKPDCVETWCKLGDCYHCLLSLEVGEKRDVLRQKAVDCFKKAINIQPGNAKAHNMLGDVLWGDDFRKALVEYEIAAKHDPEFEKSVAHAKSVIEECTYKLSNLKIIGLKSLRERPLPQVFDEVFYFDGDILKSAVMFSCVSGTKRQWTHAWLFSSETPDLFKEKPIAEIAIPSIGESSVSKGCPPNYRALLEKLYKEDLL